jgi:hypothetical protein
MLGQTLVSIRGDEQTIRLEKHQVGELLLGLPALLVRLEGIL